MNGLEKSDLPIVAGKPAERSGARRRGIAGAKGRDQRECGPAKHGPDAEPGSRVTCAGPHTRSLNQEQSTAADPTPALMSASAFCGRDSSDWKKNAAPGVDGLTWTNTRRAWRQNLQSLHARVHGGGYRALASRRDGMIFDG